MRFLSYIRYSALWVCFDRHGWVLHSNCNGMGSYMSLFEPSLDLCLTSVLPWS